MKMKQVCEKTGLTEKAVRLYVREELVHPTVTEGLHNASFDFSEEDVEQLKVIAALRAAEFSMADIRQLQEHPDQLPAFLEERRTLLEAQIRQKKALAAAMDRLSAAQTGSLQEVADSMRPAERQELESTGGKTVPILALTAIVALLLWLTFREAPPQIIAAAVAFAGILLGCLCVVMSGVYASCMRRAAKLPNRAVGTVISVTKQTGYDASFSIQTTATMGGAPRWGGIGGDWVWFFMLWNEIRPDHWLPVIQFTDGSGTLRSGTFQYGGLKHCFHEGEQLEIAWGKYPARVQPLQAPWMYGKAAAYFAIGMAVLLASGSVFFRMLEVLVNMG